jgi:penicillin-insensitive murein endopeptidase
MFAALASALCVVWPSHAGGRSDSLPKKFKRAPYALMSLSVGYPNAGWQLRSVKLAKSRYLQIKSGSAEHVWGHPALVKMLRRSARDIGKTVKGSRMLVGDLSAREGGPLSGHHSHQSGRDADVAFYARDAEGKRIELDGFVSFGADGKAKNGSKLVFDDHMNWLLVQSWLNDHRAGLSHIFVSTPLRKRLLAYAGKHKRYKKYVADALALLKEPSNAEAHDDHFHVRISCPKRQSEICREEPK